MKNNLLYNSDIKNKYYIDHNTKNNLYQKNIFYNLKIFLYI